MYDEPHVRLVDAHSEGYRGDDYFDTLHEEGILVVGARLGIHSGMVRQRLDAVGHEQFGKLLDLLAAEAVYDSALARILFDVLYYVALRVAFRTEFVIEVRTVERRLEYRGVGHSEVLLYVHLHLRGGRCGERYERCRADIVDYRAYSAVLRTEVMSPLGYAVRFVDGVERNLYLSQECDVVLLGERFRGEIEQFGLAGQNVFAHLLHGILVQRRVEEVRYAWIAGEGSHRVDLVLHQGDERRYDYGHAVHHQCRKLVAERFSTARRHKDECVAFGQKVEDYRFLIAFKGSEPEVFFELTVKQFFVCQVLRHLEIIFNRFAVVLKTYQR